MKRSLLIGSLLCIALGIIAIFSGIIQAPVKLTTLILLILYFVGIPIQYSKCLPESDARKLADGTIYAVYGSVFWSRISLGFVASVLIAMAVYKLNYLPFGSAFLVGLGSTAILTAFVSPKFEAKKEVEEFA